MNYDYERPKTMRSLIGHEGLEETAELDYWRKILDKQVGMSKRIQVEKDAMLGKV